MDEWRRGGSGGECLLSEMGPYRYARLSSSPDPGSSISAASPGEHVLDDPGNRSKATPPRPPPPVPGFEREFERLRRVLRGEVEPSCLVDEEPLNLVKGPDP